MKTQLHFAQCIHGCLKQTIATFAIASGLLALLSSSAFAATTQKTTRYEAEDATVVVGNIRSWGGGYSGTGFVVSPNTSGDYLEWTVAAEATGTAELVFGYTLGGSNDRPMEIKVNGVVVAASHSFPPTGGWDNTYKESASLTVALNAGNNTIRASAVTQGPQMDYLQVKEILPLSGEVMTVYEGANLSGTSANIPATHVVHSGASLPGGLDNQISSFVLTQGYMAVVADSADGTQSSKVYVAHDGPLTVNALPANLDDAISFIRVMPWKNTLKKGFCGGNDSVRSNFDHSWYYSWTQGVERGLRTTGPEFAPMCWDEKYVQIDKFLAQEQVTHLLSFNEPDGVNQGNMPDIAVAVGLHKELEKAGLRLGSPACEEQDAFGAAGKWLPDFMDLANAQGVRVDYINVHWYDWGSSPGTNTNPDPVDVANRLRGYLANVYAHHRKPIWITEFNANPNRSRAIQDGFLQEVLPYLDDLAYVERYAYYQWNDTMKFVDDATGELTTTGQIYSDHQSPEAYVSLDLPTEWQAADIGTTHEGAALYNGNFTISGSGTGLSGASDGLHYVYQPMSGNVEVTAQVTSQIWKNAFSMSGVMIREDLSADSKQATMALSASRGSQFRIRTTTGGSVADTRDDSIPRYNYWVRLVRQGDTITGYQSPDGITWTQVGSPTTIAMGAEFYVGMAVTSSNDGGFNDAIFKNVSVTSLNAAPAADAGLDDGVELGQVMGEPLAGAYFEWDAAQDTPGDNVWESTTANAYNWTFDAGGLSPVAVSDARFMSLTHAYPFPIAQDASSTTFNSHGSDQAATFEFVIDVDGTDGSIFETGGNVDGLQVDIVNGVLRGTVQETTPARVSYTLTPTDMGRFIHVAFVADPTNDVVKLYVDGVLQDSAAWTGPDWSGGDPASLGEMAKTMPTDGSTDPFNGQLALFRYYRNQAFSDVDAQTNFNALIGSPSASITLDGSASDADGDALDALWSVVSGPGNVSFSDDTALNSTATFTVAGDYTLRLSVNDNNGGQDSDEVVITVTNPVPPNQAPVASNGSSTTDEDTAVAITLVATDADGDALSYSVVSAPSNGTLSGSGENLTYTPNAGFFGADSFTFLANDGTEDSNVATVSITVNEVVASNRLVRTTVSGVSNTSWTTVDLGLSYDSLVVVATPIHPDATLPHVATRITNVTATGFDLKVDRTDGLTDPVSIDVSIIAVEEGVYTQAVDGVTMEAVKYNSTITSSRSSWVSEARSFQNSYTNPVVVGQVMSTNDANWSVFWSMGDSRTNPVDAANLNVGKHVGEDPNTTRANETIGYIVIESGSGTLNGVAYEAGVGADTVGGFENSATPNVYGLSGSLASVSSAAVSIAGMDGLDGGWAVLSGSPAMTATSIGLHVCEDTLGDAERKHTNEQISYIVFE